MSYQADPPFLTATIVGVAFSAAFSSLCYGITYLSVPSLLLSAPKATDKAKPKSSSGHLARQWQVIYDIGKASGPPISITAAGSLIYAMTRIPAGLTTQRRLYVAAASLFVSIMPFTLIVLAPTNTKLLKRAAVEAKGEEIEEREGQSTPELIRHWAGLNAVRGIPPILGIGCVVAALTF